jgi:Leucine-rich repeat (LRR) protein
VGSRKPKGPVYVDDLDTLTALDASSSSVFDLNGLEYCYNLAEQYVARNRISDISPLASLSCLTELKY